MEKSVSTGLKVWLWIIIVLSGLNALTNLRDIVSSPVSTVINLALNAIYIYACVLIMFQMKKFGLKLMVIIATIQAVLAVLAFVLVGLLGGAALGSMVGGAVTGLIGAIISILLAAVYPGITYLFMKKDWAMFE